MFEALTDKLQAAFRAFRSGGRLSEADLKAGLREVRLALLEADVNLQVVKDFIARITERAVGEEVAKSLTPGQQVVQIVHQELIGLLGDGGGQIKFAAQPPTVVVMLGLQGGGKTTTCGKLALWAKGRGRSPLLVATDVRRPAAIEQLEVVGRMAGVPVFSLGDKVTSVEVAQGALAQANAAGRDMVIVDTQGRLHTDEQLMGELREVVDAVKPHESLIVLDAMTGQDAVRVASDFCAQVPVTGVILTKLDGDARGGAALSVRAVTGKPVKFAGVGEKLEALEPFHPERIASRILGMGDVLTLIEKAQAGVDQEQALAMAKRLSRAELDLQDFLDQMRQARKIGPIKQLLGMIPGAGQMKDLEVDEDEIKYAEAIILSMTADERHNPDIIGGSRRRRIARGSGVEEAEVSRLLKEFTGMRKKMKQMTGRGRRKLGPADLFHLMRSM